MRDGGILSICALEERGEKGFMPKEVLVEKATAFFAYRTIGVTRMYAALGANRQIDLLVRCFNTSHKREWKYVVIDGEQFRIDAAQPQDDAVDLTLIRLEEFYDLFTE